MTKPNPPAKKSRPDIPSTPVPPRVRHDGWTAERQTDFIDALAETGCVTDAARRVGLSRNSAYRLRADPEAGSFRLAWDNALEFAMLQLQDAVVSRAINGVAIPHYYQGEQVGEHRRYNDRLAQFLLRTRRPALYGPWAEKVEVAATPDLYAQALEQAIRQIESGHIEGDGAQWMQGLVLKTLKTPEQERQENKAAREQMRGILRDMEIKLNAIEAREARKAQKQALGLSSGGGMGGDVVSPLSPSADTGPDYGPARQALPRIQQP